MWRQKLKEMLPLLGHRNWILVTDKAFPLQSAPGMTCLDTGGALPDVLAAVLGGIAASPHIAPIIYCDKELEFLYEGICPGVGEYREALEGVLAPYAAGSLQTLMHEQVFEKLDAASRMFAVVVLKTECLVPYSSVFIELDCGYWDSEREQALRQKM